MISFVTQHFLEVLDLLSLCKKGRASAKIIRCSGCGLFVECKEGTFDFAPIASAQEKRSISFIALYSNVKNMTSLPSILVTNPQIYLKDARPIAPHVEINKEELTLRNSLSTLTENTKFLPDGGYLGFGLHYMYPTLFNCELYRLSEAMNSLTGREAMIKCVLDQLGLCPELKII